MAILGNLWHLARLHEELPESARARLQVRIYTAAPSVQMYRWDGKAFISFFPVRGSTFDTQQIEAYVSTPLGEFVDDRFDELWETAPVRDLAACLTLRLCLRQGGRDLETCEALYVRSDGEWYIAGADLVRNVARHGLGGLSVVLDRPEAAGEVFAIGEADELAPPVYHRVLELFRAKYGFDGRQDTENRVIFNLTSTSLTTV